MGMGCRPVDANVKACRQTGLREADRREMATTCYIAAPPLLSTSQLHHHTHMDMNLHAVWVFACVLCPQSCPVLPEAARGMDVLSAPLLSSLSSSILLLSHTRKHLLTCSPLVFCFDLSLPRYLFFFCGRLVSFFFNGEHMLSPHPPYLSQVVFQPPQVCR